MRHFTPFLPAICLFVAACSQSTEESFPQTNVAEKPSAPQTNIVTAVAETEPTSTDGANDPALWFNAQSPADSLILGTSEAGGIEIYDLNGKRLAARSDRPATLVDVIYQAPLADGSADIAVAFDPSASEIVSYLIDPTAPGLEQISGTLIYLGAEAEGLCHYRSRLDGRLYVFAAAEGVIRQWDLYGAGDGIEAGLIREIPVGLGAAHCVVDDRTSKLFYSQETVGVWMLNAEPESEAVPEPVSLAEPFGPITGDTKGLGLVQTIGDSGFLLVSDADLSRYLVYELSELQFRGSFDVPASGHIGAVNETEGMAALPARLSDAFPAGMLVLSDDHNDGAHTNYKMVSWQAVADALGLAGVPDFSALRGFQATVATVTPDVETVPVVDFGDAADDPAIWVHPGDPAASIVIGTQKQRALNVYDLEGRLLQSVQDGRINNVDIRYDFDLNGRFIDIAAASNRSSDSIGLYAIDAETRTLSSISDGVIPSEMSDPYGLCMYRSGSTGDFYVFVNDTNGVVHQWQLAATADDLIGASRVRSLQLGSQTEGCVADDEAETLYIGEEDVGIWKYGAEPDSNEPPILVDSVANGHLTADVEGLSIYLGPGEKGFLIASNQGADNYVVYRREGNNEFLGHFHVTADPVSGIDGSSETDGLDITSANLGPSYPNGMLVVQDGRNISPAERQNFKYVSWDKIAAALNLDRFEGRDPRSVHEPHKN